MSYFIKDGSSFRITNEANIDIRKELPVGTYTVMQDMAGLYLEAQEDPVNKEKIYGGALDRVDRIINTFFDRPSSTGVVLQGEKGSGKTLLARLLSERLRDHNVSTILVNSPFAGESFNTFVSQIEQPTMILFDEFEKVYDSKAQDKLLTLLDGTHGSQKLFVATLNDFYRVNDFMKNRPGRFYYSFKYEGLESREVQEFCEDKLNRKDRISSVVAFAQSFHKFNFDILKGIVEEMNRYDEPISEVVKHLNARPNDAQLALEIISVEVKGEVQDHKFNKLEMINPFSDSFYIWGNKGNSKVSYGLTSEDLSDTDDEEETPTDYLELHYTPTDLVRMDSGRFVYQNSQGTVILGKAQKKVTAMEKYLLSLDNSREQVGSLASL